MGAICIIGRGTKSFRGSLVSAGQPDVLCAAQGSDRGIAWELNACLQDKLPSFLPDRDSLGIYAGLAAHGSNRRYLPCFHGKNSRQVFFPSEERVFSKLEQTEIYDIVLVRDERILAAMNQFRKSARKAVGRVGAEFWLQARGFIKAHIPQDVSPNFIPIWAP